MRIFVALPRFAAIFSGCALVACAAPPAPLPPPPPPPPPASAGTNVPDYSRMERDIVHLVNVERSRNGLDTLVFSAALEKAARVQAVEMAAEHKMAHDLPAAQYPTLKDRIHYAGYNYRHIDENIAYGYPSATITVKAWMASAGHRANILDRAVIETGVGVARAKTGELYYSQVFGSRLY